MAVSAQIVYTGDTANIHRRVSLTDYRGNVVLDTLVRPTYVLQPFLLVPNLIAAHLVNGK